MHAGTSVRVGLAQTGFNVFFSGYNISTLYNSLTFRIDYGSEGRAIVNDWQRLPQCSASDDGQARPDPGSIMAVRL